MIIVYRILFKITTQRNDIIYLNAITTKGNLGTFSVFIKTD